MYGLLLESIVYSVTGRYGEEVWQEIRERAGLPQTTFSAHKCYDESLIPDIAIAASEVTGESVDSFMEMMGTSFVNFMSQYGYDTILKVLGRNMRDFLNGLDNLHAYLRTSYPNMRSPSFFVDNETKYGMTLHYRSKRKGFLYYVMGQIKQVAQSFYDTQIDIEVLKVEERGNMSHVIMQLHFENKGFKDAISKKIQLHNKELKVKPAALFNAFPFHVLFGRDMKIKSIGRGLHHVMSDIMDKRLDFVFNLSRPPLGFTFDNILTHTNNAFELISVKVFTRRLDRRTVIDHDAKEDLDTDSATDNEALHMKLKGQMKYIDSLDCFIFLATPLLENIDRMFELGLFLNDLSMHDVSRDLVLIGIQQSKDLKSALNQERQKSKKLEEIMKMVESEKHRTDQLLYQMIPKEVADQLRSGITTEKTCSIYKEASVMFSDVEDFNWICSQVTPMQIVSMLNSYFTKFDKLTERHNVYKVETVGSTYMIVSGAPTKRKHHAVYITEMALDAMDSIQEVTDPSCGDHIRLRIGIHSGPIVAGVVGLQVPRYCLFGDTVNTASRMQSNGAPMKIHVTEVTKKLLETHPYDLEKRGTIEIKGKGEMNTYFILRRQSNEPYRPPPSPKLVYPGSMLSLSSSIRPSRANVDYTPVKSDLLSASQESLAPSKVAMAGSTARLDSSSSPNGNGVTHDISYDVSHDKAKGVFHDKENSAPALCEGGRTAKTGMTRAKTCTLI